MDDRDKFIEFYFNLGMTQREILSALAHNQGIILSQRHLRRILSRHSLGRRKNFSDIGDVVLYINETLANGNKHGYRWMFNKLELHGMRVRKEDVRVILQALDPEGALRHKHRRLHRRQYVSDGPNSCWHLDGYDKLKPFGLCISGCIDGFSRKLIWLKVYRTNNDPKIIAGYYIEAIEANNACPEQVRGDCGTENVIVKRFQNHLLRHNANTSKKPYLEGTSTANQRIEMFWGHLRKQLIEKWLITLHSIQEDGCFVGDFLDRELVLFCFLRQLQVNICICFIYKIYLK